MNQPGGFEQPNAITPADQERTLEVPVAETQQESAVETPEAYAETAKTEITQEASSIETEGNEKIEGVGQGFGFSEESLRELRSEYHIDEQLKKIGSEASGVALEAKNEIDANNILEGNNANMAGQQEVSPQENSTKFGYTEQGVYVGEKSDREKNRELHRADCLLEEAEAAVRDKLTIGGYAVEDLMRTIEDAKTKGVDLSQINNLEARAAELVKAVPGAEIEGSLEHIDKVPDADYLGKASWYWRAFEKFQENQDGLDVNQKNAFATQLNEAAAKIGIQNEIPPYESEKSQDAESAIAEKMRNQLVDAITAQNPRSAEIIASMIDRARGRSSLFSGELSKDLESLKLIDVPVTGDIYQDTLTLGEQIKDPDIAHYLSQGTPPVEILNEVKRSIQEWLESNKNQKRFGVLHSMVMVEVIDKILKADKSKSRDGDAGKSQAESPRGISFEFVEGGEPKIKVRPERMGDLENLRKKSLWDLHLMQEGFMDDIRKGRPTDSELRMMLMDVMLEKQREARTGKK